MESERATSHADGGDGGSEDRRRPLLAARTAQRLSTLAALLAVLALAVALVVPSLVGPGSRTAHASRGGPLLIAATCTHYTGAEVSIAVPGSGTVVVSATVGVGINHTYGVSDTARLVLGSSASDCALDNTTAFVSVPFSLPTDPFHYTTVPLLRSFPVAAAATVTFYSNGIMDAGAGPGDRFDSASLTAVYYPG